MNIIPNIPNYKEYRKFRKECKVITDSFPISGSYEELVRYTGQVDMLNKLAGNAPVSYKFLPHEKGGTINYGLTSKAGIKLEYTELPYEWVFPYILRLDWFSGIVILSMSISKKVAIFRRLKISRSRKPNR